MNAEALRRAATAAALAASVALLCCGPAGAAEGALPVLAVDPILRGTVVEDPAEGLALWAGKGIAGALLLHVDGDSGLREIDERGLEQLRALRERGSAAFAGPGRSALPGSVTEENFVRAAIALGIVRELVWVAPFGFLENADAAAPLADYLAREGLAPAEIASFRQADGCHRGTVAGAAVRICGQRRVPRIDAPAVVDLDADFVATAADQHGLTLLAEIRVLFEALGSARCAVTGLVLAHSTHPSRMVVSLRWLGDALTEALREPALLRREQPPERWVALQRLFELKIAGPERQGEMLNLALSLLQRFPHDPALLLFAAQASIGHGGGTAALGYAKEACVVDPGYCPGLREIGLRYMGAGKMELGERFFAEAQRLRPGMGYGEFDRGIALLRAGRKDESLKSLEETAARDGAFPSEFVIGAIKATAGDRAGARAAFDRAYAFWQSRRGLYALHPEVAMAIQKAAEFYREEGLAERAERLENDPDLQLPPPEPAP